MKNFTDKLFCRKNAIAMMITAMAESVVLLLVNVDASGTVKLILCFALKGGMNK